MCSSDLRKGLVLKVGSDDQSRVYVNGTKVYENVRGRGLRPDEDTVTGVELRAGRNVVVFKIVNVSGPWGCSLRFTDANNQPVEGLKVTVDPD